MFPSPSWRPPFNPPRPLGRPGLPPPPPLPNPLSPINAIMQQNQQLGLVRRNSSPNQQLRNIAARIRAQMNAANSLNFSNSSLSLLTKLLPGLVRVITTYNLDISAAITSLITSHSPPPDLDPTDLLLAYETCLSATKAAKNNSEHLLLHGSRGLTTHLRTTLSNERAFALRPTRLPETLRAFRALAEVSQQTSSRYLGEILYDFFRDYPQYFFLIHDPQALACWISALARLYIPASLIYNVVETAVRECPDVVEALEEHVDTTAETDEAFRLAVEVEEALKRRGRFGHRRPRLRRRSSTPEFWGRRGWRGGDWGRALTPPPPPPRRPLTAPPDPRLARQARKVMEGARKLRRMAEGNSD